MASTSPVPPPTLTSIGASGPASGSQDTFWDSPLQFVTEAQKEQQNLQRQQLSQSNLQRHHQMTNGPGGDGAAARSSFNSSRATAPLPLPPRDVNTQLSVETPIAQQLQQHLAANDMYNTLPNLISHHHHPILLAIACLFVYFCRSLLFITFCYFKLPNERQRL